MSYTPSTGLTQPATYVAETATITGAANTVLLSLFNPSSGGVTVRVRRIIVLMTAPQLARGGVLFEIRRCTAHSGGTLLTATRYLTSDPLANCGPRQLPTSVSDQALHHSELLQSTDERLVCDILGQTGGENEPLILQGGQGVYIKEITSDTSSYRLSISWTEE